MKLTTKYLLALIATVLLLNLSVAEALRYTGQAGMAGQRGPQGLQGLQGPPGPAGGGGYGAGQYTIPYPIYQEGAEVTQFDDIVLSSIKYDEGTLAVTLTMLINDILWALQPDGSYGAQTLLAEEHYLVFLDNTCTRQAYLLAKGYYGEPLYQPAPRQTFNTKATKNTFYLKTASASTVSYTAQTPLYFISPNHTCHNMYYWAPTQNITALTTIAPPNNTLPITFIFPSL